MTEDKHTVKTTDNRLTATPLPHHKLDMRICARDIFKVIVNVCAQVGRGSPTVTELED